MNDLLEEAHAYLRMGYSVCPIDTLRNKAPHDAALIQSGHSELRTGPHGRPARPVGIWRDLQHTRPTPAMLDLWFGNPDGRGVALVTGQLSGVVVLDFDGAPGVALLSHLGLRPHTRTPSGGYHVHVRHPGWPVRTVASKNLRDGSLPGGLDVRGDGGMAMLPPTLVPDKGFYTRLRDMANLLSPQELPEDLRRATGLHSAPVPRAVQLPLPRHVQQDEERWPSDDLLHRALERVQRGDSRNETGFWLARMLHNNRYSEQEIRQVGERYVDHVPDVNTKGTREHYAVTHFMASLRQVLRNPPGEPWQRRAPIPERRPSLIDIMQEHWGSYSPQRRERLAHLVTLLWKPHKPLEDIVVFFRLLGYDDAAQITNVYQQDPHKESNVTWGQVWKLIH
ncbi:bifunctional DNA primase/polymerase [Deinococcus ruber]|uniref:DNA primase/polymerase bifunctional N-terminal domain-containing protein n=1 Tax=Deinococcus ruber TaxID=1848197 RepID=A0A918F6M7_9DEIO|nr:bifunctional DNA primase/polymerase [Deinococcus ruber]GGR09844.1 hypothetical protein GCM10008957_23260 [Deinococcus ruber]